MLVVVGGHTRNIGKTSVVAGLIRALPHADWTAMKITQFGHGVCSVSGTACDCCLVPECPFAIMQEQQPNDSDSGRFLAAGARRSYWVRTGIGHLANALPAIREICGASRNVIIESNSIIEFLRPDRYLVVLDFAVADFKASSARFLDRADACVVIDHARREDMRATAWQGAERSRWERMRQFRVRPPEYVTPAMAAFVEAGLAN